MNVSIHGFTRRTRSLAVRLAARLPISSRFVQRWRTHRAELFRCEAQLAAAEARADTARRDLEHTRVLVQEQARLWNDAVSNQTDGSSVGTLEVLRKDGRFSYQLFEQRRAELTADDNMFGLGPKTAARVIAEAGPVRFESPTIGPAPDETIAFATVCTDKFTPGLEALICSMLAVYPDLRSDFWVFHDEGLTQFSQQRLREFYPHFRFASRDAGRYTIAASGDSPNQQRIGALGYLTIEALLLDAYRRVVILDSDLIVLDDVSPLWESPDRADVRVVADAGVVPLLTTSELTGRAVFNSGVISLPADLLGEGRYAEALETLPEMESVTCPVLRDFADQKFWNVYLSRFDLTYLPASLNANKQLLDRYLPDQRGDAAIVHYTGVKPWFTFASTDLVTQDDRQRSVRDHAQYPYAFARWNETYRRLVGARRRSSFRAAMGEHLDGLRDSGQGRRAALIGNGPSLQRTNLEALSDRVRIGFNWFVNHDRFDEVQLDHLMVMSHMFFGGWHTVDPAFPPGYLDALTGHGHRPTLWFPFYFEPLIAVTPELQDFDVRYLLLEKPFKQFAEELGYLRTNLTDFLSDARTGVLTAGLPLAMHLGCDDVVLVGCDASYGSAGAGDYFYAAERHTSKSTTESSLHAAWTAGGAAHACYEVAAREAELSGVGFCDATIDGMLTAIPKCELPGLRLAD